MRKINRILLLLAAFFLLAGCEGAPPEIADTFVQITVFKNLRTLQAEEILSLFLIVRDEDGDDDLESIYLLNDSQELFWKLDALNWEKTDRKGSRWVGSSSIQMPDGSAFPRGKYRVIASDQAGDRDEKEIQINMPGIDLSKFVFPELSITDKTASVVNRGENEKFLYFNSSDRFLDFSFVPDGPLTVDNFPRINDLRSETNNKLYLYHFESEEGYGVLTGPYYRIYERLTE